MKTSGNTILITGGTSGIGLELAKQLVQLDNTVLITGRDETRLAQAKQAVPKVHTFVSDVSDTKAITQLHAKVTAAFPALNVLINNAGIMRKLNLHHDGADLDDLTSEIATNLV